MVEPASDGFEIKVEKYWTPRRYHRELKKEIARGWTEEKSIVHQRWIVVTYKRPLNNLWSMWDREHPSTLDRLKRKLRLA